MTVRVRFAPSPTGYLHLGGARTALFNWLFARRTGGTFILRVEDTDRDRSTEASERAIHDALGWLGLDWDEGPGKGGPHAPYRQSERLDLYRREAAGLVERGLAYPCFCPPVESADPESSPGAYPGTCRAVPPGEAARRVAAGEPHALRFRFDAPSVTFRDELRGDLAFDLAPLGDQVLIRRDGLPTYNFACVVDDAAMGITHVIRGDDHLSNTPKQVLYYRGLGRPLPLFHHVSMILGPDGGRLSKRHGATSVEEFRARGYLPEAMVNYLALLGWSAGDDRELYDLPALVSAFDLARVGKSAAVFDPAKLAWMNAQHLRGVPEPRYLALAGPMLAAVWPAADPARVAATLREIRPYLATLNDAVPRARVYLDEAAPAPDPADPETAECLADPDTVRVVESARLAAADLVDWEAEAIKTALFKDLGRRLGLKGPKLYKPVRLALAGVPEGPAVVNLMLILGRDRTLARLSAFTRGRP